MMRMNLSDILCIRLEFGLPLEDIFPPDAIHPRLQNLFYQTTLALEDNCIPLHRLLRKCDLSLTEVFDLKNALINGKLRYREGISPGSFFWLIRHFLGLLPLPLFPRFADNTRYNWEYLAAQCQLNETKSNRQLSVIADISWWLHKLPKANVMLIYNLINFLRNSCLKRNSSKRLNWNNVIQVTTYFSSSIFFRSYQPGTVTTTDQLYYPLLCYIIVYWNKIRKHKNEYSQRINNSLPSVWECEEPTSEVCNDFIKNKCTDCACQTTFCDLISHISDKSVEVRPQEEKELNDNKFKNVSQYSQTEQESKLYRECGVNTIEPNKEKGEKHYDCKEHSNDYEQILDENITNSETVILKDENSLNGETSLTPKVAFQGKIAKVNRSLVNVISKVNETMKRKQEVLKSKSGTKIERCKYSTLKDSNVEKVKSLHANHCVKDSPNIKYKKLMTL